MRFIIPTYHRPTWMTTPRLLVDDYEIDPHDITICMQSRDDVISYADTDVIPRGCEVLVNLHAHNAASNRNTGLREHIGELCLLMDDDIRSISIRNPMLEPDETRDPAPHRGKGVRQQRITSSGFMRMISDWSKIIEGGLGSIVSMNVNDNSGHLSYMSYEGRFRTNGALIGQAVMLRSSEDLMMNEEISYGEDIELGVRNMNHGGVTVRDTSWIIGTRNRVPSRDKEIPGGILKDLPLKDEMLSRVASMYPDVLVFESGWNIPRFRRGIMGTLRNVPEDLLRPAEESYFLPKEEYR